MAALRKTDKEIWDMRLGRYGDELKVLREELKDLRGFLQKSLLLKEETNLLRLRERQHLGKNKISFSIEVFRNK